MIVTPRAWWPFWRDIVKAVIVVSVFLAGYGALRLMNSYFGTYDIFLGIMEYDYRELLEAREAQEKEKDAEK